MSCLLSCRSLNSSRSNGKRSESSHRSRIMRLPNPMQSYSELKEIQNELNNLASLDMEQSRLVRSNVSLQVKQELMHPLALLVHRKNWDTCKCDGCKCGGDYSCASCPYTLCEGGSLISWKLAQTGYLLCSPRINEIEAPYVNGKSCSRCESRPMRIKSTSRGPGEQWVRGDETGDRFTPITWGWRHLHIVHRRLRGRSGLVSDSFNIWIAISDISVSRYCLTTSLGSVVSIDVTSGNSKST